jgi:hypothetical protein
MTYDRFKKFKSCRRYYDPTADNDETDVAWKARTMFNFFKNSAEEIMKYPFEVLVVDEAMMKCTSKRNPLRRVMPQKPIGCGFKFWLLVCKATGLIVKIFLDSHTDLNAGDLKARGLNHGFYGEIVLRSVRELPGRHYCLAIDKLFQSLPLMYELLKLDIRCVGPVKTVFLRKLAADNIFFSKAKHAKPTQLNPKGTVKGGHNKDGSVHAIGFMDNAAVYFLDSLHGYDKLDIVIRNSSRGIIENQAPKCINWYNNHMNAVDVQDQLRTGVLNVERGKYNRWTNVFVTGLFSWAITNAYCVYKYHHKDSDVFLTHTAFQAQVAHALMFNKSNKELHMRLSAAKVAKEPTIGTGCYHKMGKCGQLQNSSRHVRFQCIICSSTNKNEAKKTPYYCIQCVQPVCPECFDELHNNGDKVHLTLKVHRALSDHLANRA